MVVIETQQGKFEGGEQLLGQVAAWYAKTLGIKTVYSRFAPKTRAGSEAKSGKVELIKGEPVDEIMALENGKRFIIKPAAGLASGLFLDHRENRERLAKLAKGRSVLNLFSYTCGFSVAAASGGAESTTNVDLSVAALEWGKRNFAANNLDLDKQLFIRSDTFDYFKRAKRQNRSFDIIVIDPPSFARAKKPKRAFEVKKHMVALIRESLELLNKRGYMLLATNNRQLPTSWLIEQVELASNRDFTVTAKPKLPNDFAADGALQKTIIVRFD